MNENIKKENNADNWWETAGQRNIDIYYPRLYSKAKNKIIVKKPVLEIGGGAGTFLKYMNIEDATIMDISGDKSLMGNHHFLKTNITKNIPKNKKYSTILIMETLEHIKNPLYLMSQVYDILENNGTCYISIPYTSLNYERKVKKNENPFNCHVCRWKDYEIKDQLEKVGFDVSFIEKRRRLKNKAFFLPHCWLVLKLKKRLNH
jgi:2-polyprenyl-3-methyl-5-hydroxy-6-metoxy-1,4-benzoquinol methylase